MASGIGSGIGSIFGAPLGGAVLAAEILYRDDVEAEALLPSFIASGVGYAVFGAGEGYTPIFGLRGTGSPMGGQLSWFALIGVIGGASGCCTPRVLRDAGTVRQCDAQWASPRSAVCSSG